MNYYLCQTYLFLKDWQTLSGALLALIAAYFTIREMRKQAKADDARHQRSVERKKMAARARMADALSGVCKYVSESGHYLTEQSKNAPQAPTEAIETLKQVIEHIDNDAAVRVFELVTWYQVERARATNKNQPLSKKGPLYDIVLLQAYANSLFRYARNETQSVATGYPTLKEMLAARKDSIDPFFSTRNESVIADLDEYIQKQY